jgi:hypothetical protein
MAGSKAQMGIVFQSRQARNKDKNRNKYPFMYFKSFFYGSTCQNPSIAFRSASWCRAKGAGTSKYGWCHQVRPKLGIRPHCENQIDGRGGGLQRVVRLTPPCVEQKGSYPVGCAFLRGANMFCHSTTRDNG